MHISARLATEFDAFPVILSSPLSAVSTICKSSCLAYDFFFSGKLCAATASSQQGVWDLVTSQARLVDQNAYGVLFPSTCCPLHLYSSHCPVLLLSRSFLSYKFYLNRNDVARWCAFDQSSVWCDDVGGVLVEIQFQHFIILPDIKSNEGGFLIDVLPVPVSARSKS